MMAAGGYELKPGVSWAEVTPCVERYLVQVGQQYAAEGGQPCETFGLWFGEGHPSYAVAAHTLPNTRPPYAWYIGVADLPGFIRLIAPALERRLADFGWVGWSGELKISFYRDGFENGI